MQRTINLVIIIAVLLPAMALLPAGGLAGTLHAQSARQAGDQQPTERELIDGKTAYFDGLQEFENENYRRALDLLTTAFVKLPEHAGVSYALADAYLRTGDLANASYYGQKATELAPRNKWYRMKLAEIYRHAGRNEATVDQLKKALHYHPDDNDIRYELAQTYASYGNLAESNRIYNDILRRSGEDIGIRLQKLRNFRELGMRDSIITELRAIQQLDPDNLSTLQALSTSYREVNRQGKAKSALRRALQKNQRDPKTLIMLADIYVSESKWDSVATLLGTVVSDPVVDAEAKLTITQYLFSQFKQNPGNAALQSATSGLIETFREEESDFARSHAMAADYYAMTGQTDKALSALALTTKLMPSNDDAWRQRLQLLLTGGRHEEVIRIGGEAAGHVPQDPFILFFWGSAYLAGGDRHSAVEKLQEAASLPARRPLKSAILNSLADAYAGLEAWDKAFSAYEQVLKTDPGNDLAMNNYAYYLSLQKRELDKALRLARQAVAAKPENPSYLDTLGWIYYQMESYRQAEKYIRASLDTGKASAAVMEHMGDVLNKLDRKDQARVWWEKALQKDETRTHLKDKLSQ